jgi:hypothetical protein
MDGPTTIPDSELAEMIADLAYTENFPDRIRLCAALAELRDLRRRWSMFAWCFPWMERWMIRLSRKRQRSSKSNTHIQL